MSKETLIGYCDSTINALVGCDGCELYSPEPARNHCYAATLIGRYAGLNGWPERFDKPQVFLQRFWQAARWSDLTGTDRPKKPWLNGMPRVIFLNDLGDSFTESVPIDWLPEALKVMAHTPHIWLLLTKRPKRMQKFFASHECPDNVWLGTSVTSQKVASRIGHLLRIKAKIHWLSCEPLLGPIDLSDHLPYIIMKRSEAEAIDAKTARALQKMASAAFKQQGGATIDWVICGGESGPNARPMHPDWARSLRDQCQAADVPFFFKQWGEWLSGLQYTDACRKSDPNEGQSRFACMDWDGEKFFGSGGGWMDDLDDNAVFRVGKKLAGSLLDGKEWKQFPEVRP